MKNRKAVKESQKRTQQRKLFVNTFNTNPFIQTQPFCSNRIKTAKYNIITFLPLALFRTFLNGFNIFFLFNAILMSIPNISSLSPMSAIAPFIVVICISLIREGLEDVRKHKYDRDANNSQTLTYKRTAFIVTKWSDLQVGQVIKITKNQTLPADLLVIKSSMTNGFCYLETSNLDGETALKPREALAVSQRDIKEEQNISNCLGDNAYIEVDQPNKDIYNVEGTAFLTGDNEPKCYFDIKNILLRGGKLKNVEYVYGIVLYTGRETKLMQNINHSSIKTSKIAHELNIIVLFIVIVVFIVCLLCTLFGGLFRKKYFPNSDKGKLGADYLFHDRAKGKETSDVLEIVRNFTGNFSIFSPLIPLSIIIVYAVVNTYQAIMLEFFDAELRKDEGDKVRSFSMSLQDEMGMVKYIFTDKTGTLTCNEMEFKACSIFNCLFDDGDNENNNADTFFGVNTATNHQTTFTGTRSSNVGTNISSKISKTFRKHMIIDNLGQNIPIMLNDLSRCPFNAQREAIEEFLLNLALNHNVLTEYDNEKKEFAYQGANPDEVTLVTSAAELGFRFIERNQRSITVNIGLIGQDIMKTYELLHMFEFTSSRQRSSVIVKDTESNVIKLYLKGSDKKVFDSIDQFSRENILDQTKEHIDTFARRGLRTLCYSYKSMTQSDYDQWRKEYDDLKYKCINNKLLYPELEKKIAEIENETVLLGVTALEDKLQESVREDLQKFIEAGINVWMITGDKMDTAESIGHSCKLFNEDTEVFKIKDSANQDDTLRRMKEIKEEMAQMESELKEIAMAENFESIIKEKKKPMSPPPLLEQNKSNNDDIFILDKNKICNSNSNLCKPSSNHIDNNGDNNCNVLIDIKGNSKFKDNYIHDKDNYNSSLWNDNNLKDSIKIDQDNKEANNSFGVNDNDNINSNCIQKNQQLKGSNVVHDSSILKYMAEKNYLDNSDQQFDNISMIKGRVLRPSCIGGSDHTNKSNNYSKQFNKKKEVVINIDPLMKIPPVEDKYKNNPNPLRATKLLGVPTNQKKFQEYFSKCKEELIKYNEMQNKRNLKNRLKFWKRKESLSTLFNLKMNFGLIIEGQAISECIKDGDNGQLFWELIQTSRSLICCRCSPIQKAEVVQFIKNKSGKTTLAIGDGGNDVNMIKTANVGIGLFGKEGYQAAYNSDYAISQFKYLKRLLFYNGRFSLERNAYFLYFYLFKSVLFTLPQFCLCCLSGFSGVNLYDEWYYTGYNSFVTVLPVAARAVSEEDFDPEFKNYPIRKELLHYLIPDIYKEYRDKLPFRLIRFLYIFIAACCLAVPAYLIPAYSFSDGIHSHLGLNFSYWDVSVSAYITIVIVHFFIIFFDTQYYNWLVFSLYSLQVLINLLFFIIYEKCNYGIGLSGDLRVIFQSIKFWLTLVLACAVCIIPYFIYRNFERFFGNMIVNRIKIDKCEDFYIEKYYKRKIAIMTRATRSVAKFRKIYQRNNCIKEGEFDNYADQQMRKIVDEFRQRKRKKNDQENNNNNNPNKANEKNEVEIY